MEDDIRWKQRFANYEKACTQLSEFVEKDELNKFEEQPLLTIQTAANHAKPGDVITVHEGIYRERITPPRGGTSNDKRIVYRAAEGEHVEIKGSEIIKKWKKFTGDVWKVVVPNAFFGNYNPFKDIIHGDWFNDN